MGNFSQNSQKFSAMKKSDYQYIVIYDFMKIKYIQFIICISYPFLHQRVNSTKAFPAKLSGYAQ